MNEVFKLTILLGAGASIPANLPDIEKMTSNFYTQYIDNFNKEERESISILKNITESYFTERKDLESFMSLIKSLEDTDLKSLLQHKFEEINQLDDQTVSKIYRKTQSFVRKSLENIKYENIDYLSPLIGFLEDQSLEIFTLNYDGIIELFCERNKIIYSDGFSPYWNPKIFDNEMPVKVYKLHGSLYWFKTGMGKSLRIPVVGLDLEKARHISLEDLSEMIIYPTLKKEKYSETYSWLNNKFISTLNVTNLLIIIGYSFRDEDIRTIIKESMVSNDLWILIISPNAKVIKNTYFNDKVEISSRIIALNYNISDILEKGLLYKFYKKLKKVIQDEENLWKIQHQVPDPYGGWYEVVKSYNDLQLNDRIDYIKKRLERYFSQDRVNEIISTSTRTTNLWNKV